MDLGPWLKRYQFNAFRKRTSFAEPHSRRVRGFKGVFQAKLDPDLAVLTCLGLLCSSQQLLHSVACYHFPILPQLFRVALVIFPFLYPDLLTALIRVVREATE